MLTELLTHMMGGTWELKERCREILAKLEAEFGGRGPSS
jgi:hypothetical protein